MCKVSYIARHCDYFGKTGERGNIHVCEFIPIKQSKHTYLINWTPLGQYKQSLNEAN